MTSVYRVLEALIHSAVFLGDDNKQELGVAPLLRDLFISVSNSTCSIIAEVPGCRQKDRFGKHFTSVADVGALEGIGKSLHGGLPHFSYGE
jgi:hypothetical protein